MFPLFDPSPDRFMLLSGASLPSNPARSAMYHEYSNTNNTPSPDKKQTGAALRNAQAPVVRSQIVKRGAC